MTFVMYQENLRDVFNRTKNIIGKKGTVRPCFEGIHFIASPNGLLAEATEGHKLCTMAYNLETAPKKYCDFSVEPFAVPKAPNDKPLHPAEVTINEDTVDFKFPATGDMKAIKRLSGDFLDVAAALPVNDPDLQINLNADYLMDAIKATKPERWERKPVTLNIFGKNPLAICTLSCGTRCCMVLPVRPKNSSNGQMYDNPLDIINVSRRIDTENRKAKKEN